MTLLPENARSEFVMPVNPSGGGVLEIFRMFQIASPASLSPALSPTRGSGDGAAISGADMSGDRVEPGLDEELLDDAAHPAAARDAIVIRTTEKREVMGRAW